MTHMQELSAREMAQVEGGFLFGFLAGVVAGAIFMLAVLYVD